MTIAQWVKKEQKQQKKEKEERAMKKGEVKAGKGGGAVTVKPPPPTSLLGAGGFKDSKPQVIAGTAGVVHKNPSSKPAVVAASSKGEKHLYGMGGTRAIAKLSHPHPEHKGTSVVAQKLK